MQEDFAKGFFEVAMTAEPKPKTVALTGLDADFQQRQLSSARVQAKLAGLEVVYDKSYPPSTVDYTPIIRAIQAAKPDIVYFASYPPNSVGLLRATYEAKLTATVLGGGMIGPQITASRRSSALCSTISCAGTSTRRSQLSSFAGVEASSSAIRGRGKEKSEALGLYAPPLAYAQMQVLEQAVARVGKIDQAAIGPTFTPIHSPPSSAT